MGVDGFHAVAVLFEHAAHRIAADDLGQSL